MTRLRIVGCLMLLFAVAAVGAAAQDASTFYGPFGVRCVAVLAETYVKGLIDAMHVMTATNELQSGDWETMEPLLAQFEESELSYNAWFLLPDGSYYKVETGLASANLSDRAYFAPVMAGETTFGNLVLSRSTGRKSVVLTAPIVTDETVIGALGVTLYLDDFSTLLKNKLGLPFGLSFYAVADSGEIALHPDTALILEPNASAGIEMMSGGIQISDYLGWTFVLGTPEE